MLGMGPTKRAFAPQKARRDLRREDAEQVVVSSRIDVSNHTTASKVFRGIDRRSIA